MRTVIISDIKSKEDSIIPYGLYIAKLLGSEADVVHIIDPRIEQGVSSSYADSQTITPGDKLDHEEIIEKEIMENRMKNVSLVSSGPEIETMVFTGHNYFDILEEQIQDIKPDLIISFNEDRGYFNLRSPHSSDLKHINCSAGCVPVLFLA